MRSRLTPFLVAALSALLMLIVILITLENKTSKTEKQLAGSTRLFVDETVKAVLIGYFHRDCILKSIEEGDIESVSHNLEYLMEDNAPLSGVRVVIDGTPFIELGDIITHNDTVAVKGDMPYTIFYDEGFLLAATVISDGRGAQNADDSYALIAIKLSSIIDLLTDERYVLSEKANTKIYGSLGIRLARDINMGNAFSLVFAFVISYLFMVFIQTKTEKGFVVAKNRE
ncbi:MAG TPA: hypothetical protein PKG97_02575, partial [Mesotoga infera]|nr:hypothetical protein [Mesotoga infera]